MKLPENLLVRDSEPHLFVFEDDGVIPNHPHWPLIVYRSAVRLPPEFDPASVFEDLFAQNKWELMAEWCVRLCSLPFPHSRSLRDSRGNSGGAIRRQSRPNAHRKGGRRCNPAGRDGAQTLKFQ